MPNNSLYGAGGFSRKDYVKDNQKKVALIYVIVLLIVVAVIVVSMHESELDKLGLRPQLCDEVGCVKTEVFEDLPDYPSDFMDKKVMVMAGRMMDMSKIGEEYWKQPEFYENSFESQCIQYYTGKTNMRFSAGSGGYPADMVIKNASQGDVFLAKTFWHAGCGIHKYQAFGLETLIPAKMSIRLSDVKVSQDPKIAEECFEVRMIPERIILSPSYPKYTYNWTQQVEAEITVSANCPSGFYGLQFMPASLSDRENEELLMKYGATKLSGMYVGGLWQLAIEVI